MKFISQKRTSFLTFFLLFAFLICCTLHILVQFVERKSTESFDILPGAKSPCMVELFCKRYYQDCSNSERKAAVKEAFNFSWQNYKKFAWGHDHLRPDTQSFDNDLFGLGATLVDSLTSLHVMGFDAEFSEAKEWIKRNLNPGTFALVREKVSLFEITIRIIGSLLSAYYLSDDLLFLSKATEIGDIALSCFDSDPIPYLGLYLAEGRCELKHLQACLHVECNPDNPNAQCKYNYCSVEIAEVGTLSLEFRALSKATGDTKYWDAIEKLNARLFEFETWDGLVSQSLYRGEGTFDGTSDVGTGPGIDSYYEYLLKQWIQSNFTALRYKHKYMEAVEGIRTHLMTWVRVRGRRVPLLGYRPNNGTIASEMHHLSCFLPGTLALGYHFGLPDFHLKLAEDIMQDCFYFYQAQATGLAGELNRHSLEGFRLIVSGNYLRPETVESLFVLWRVTRDPRYREMGWHIFKGFERASRRCNGYSSIVDVSDPQSPSDDRMESFFLAETLKYLYLLFEDDVEVLPLEKWVFNTEAHPLPVMDTY